MNMLPTCSLSHYFHSKELMRYPKLQAKLVEVVAELLRERLGPTSTYVESLIAIERAYINTNHPDFMGAAGAMSSLESESRKKKKHDSSGNNKRRLHRQPSMNSVSSAVRANGAFMIDDDNKSTTTTIDGISSPPRENGQGQHDSFLNYFFGGAGKAERPALNGSPDMPNGLSNHHQQQHYAPPMSVSTLMETEIEKKMEQVTLQNGNGEETTYPVSDREEIETQLIRKSKKFQYALNLSNLTFTFD
jgi:dynamin 1-like protein